MANKTYWVTFGSGNGASFSGLTPTMILFQTENGGTLAPPGITERIAGTGAYQFSYDSATMAIFFRVDGGASVVASNRYIEGVLDPLAYIDQKLGYTTDSFGSTSIDPTTMYGYLKRLQEFLEGNAVYNKTSGVWSVSTRGSSTLIATKTLTNTTAQATKT